MSKKKRKEKNAWQAFRITVEGFLGNHRTEKYVTVMANLIQSYKNLSCRMSLKLHFLHSHLGFFCDNWGDVSEEHGEHFYHDIQVIEKQYQGRRDEVMIGDYIWNLIREDTFTYKQKSLLNVHF